MKQRHCSFFAAAHASKTRVGVKTIYRLAGGVGGERLKGLVSALVERTVLHPCSSLGGWEGEVGWKRQEND